MSRVTTLSENSGHFKPKKVTALQKNKWPLLE